MMLLHIIIMFAIVCCYGQTGKLKRLRRLQMHPALQFKQRLIQTHRKPDRVCYETVGCFDIHHKRSPLIKIPESPEIIDTKFFLFKRDIQFSQPQMLRYEDNGLSLNQSKFNLKHPVKVIIHGYLGRWSEKGAMESADAYLKIYDCNIILVDWEKGARGPQYANAAANTEIVGRQLGILLLHMINQGLKPQDLHLLGFSLGAHVAGCASELLKDRGYLIGRITGLDAASPLFRHNHIREKSRKLDKGDAVLVDAIHTDASPFFTDGFGLLEPIGHVDFFPNGGFEQPGCVDSRASVVVSHFEGSLSRDMACSHIRAWQLFLESLKRKASNQEDCEFIAFKCRGGLGSFQKGQCFPEINTSNPLTLDVSYRTDLGKLGEDVKGEGVMYLSTKASRPFCGTQLHASVWLSQRTPHAKGLINMHLDNNNSSADFRIYCETSKLITSGNEISGLTATTYKGVNPQVETMSANLIYIHAENEGQNRTNPIIDLYIDRITIKDMYGNSWNFCGKDTFLQHLGPISINLSKKRC